MKHAFRRGGKLVLRTANRAKDHGSRVNPYARLDPDDMSDLEECTMWTTKNGNTTVVLMSQDESGVEFRTADGDTHKSASQYDFFSEFREATREEIEAFERDDVTTKSDASDLKAASDDELRKVIFNFTGDKTQSGLPEMASLNTDIIAAGFLPINAAKRDELLA